MQRGPGNPPVITDDLFHRICADESLPTAVEQLESLIELIGDKQVPADAFVDLDSAYIAGVIGTADDTSKSESSGLKYVSKYAEKNGWIEIRAQPTKVGLRLTFEGWTKYDQIKHSPTTARLAFMAMRFGDEALDRVYQQSFKPAVARTGFELRKLNEKQAAGLIDNQLRVAIRTARFLVADLTHGNQGAYWEAGFAEGLGRPVIYTCEKTVFSEVKTHFDTNHHVTVQWDAANLTAAADDLAATIRNTLPSNTGVCARASPSFSFSYCSDRARVRGASGSVDGGAVSAPLGVHAQAAGEARA